MITKGLALAAMLLIGTAISAQPKEAALKDYYAALVRNGDFNGGVLVAEGGKIVYEESFGYADFEKHIAMTGGTAFPVASITKTVTATAVQQLASAGKLRVEDPVKNYLPWFPYPGIAVRHLLSHTSGLPPYNAFFDSLHFANPNRVFTNADFAAGLLANPKPLRYQPGERGNYDNINFLVLALLVEQLSGERYADYISRHILQPAGMTGTRLVPPAQQYDDAAQLSMARPYLFPHRYSDSFLRASRALRRGVLEGV